ncbi:isochorismatase family cysteine hydrolase [Nocardia sp. NPDC006630]|uniref:cysteine hydrolase family protein n=1 Tax=Nocardia sp. NPDC006630 TaxID=3157181 RepID=UPI0033BB76AB
MIENISDVTPVTADLVLICIDVQQDFAPARGGDGGAAPQITALRALIDTAREHRVPVVFIRELHHPTHTDLGREVDGVEDLHTVEGTPGADYVPGFGPLPTEYEVRKRRYSAFFGTDLDIILRGYQARTLILTGGLTDVCVHYTAVDAHQHDYHFRVVEDAVYGSSVPAHAAALEAMAYLQRDGVISAGEAADLLMKGELPTR